MATIYKRLSSKSNPDGKVQILLTLRNGRDYCLRAKSGIYVTPDNFKKGEIVINRRRVGNDIKYYETQRTRMENLCNYIYGQVEKTPKDKITADWFKTLVDDYNHPKDEQQEDDGDNFSALMEKFLKAKVPNAKSQAIYRVLIHDIARYSGFLRATDEKRADFKFDVSKVTKDIIVDFYDYLRNEDVLAKEYPQVRLSKI